tara:strand:+ start:396 stop:590 length:195 start_codon:yes stop_codon:yes gene_type:complete
MKTLMTILSATLIFLGIAMMAGSGGDCDGKCMEQANTFLETLMYAVIGLTLFVSGGLIAINNKQ